MYLRINYTQDGAMAILPKPFDKEFKMTNVVHCKRSSHDVYIGRPSKWGNPFQIGNDGTRKQVVEKYRNWIQTQPDLLNALPELKDKTLGCWCSPELCHGNVLAELCDKD